MYVCTSMRVCSHSTTAYCSARRLGAHEGAILTLLPLMPLMPLMPGDAIDAIDAIEDAPMMPLMPLLTGDAPMMPLLADWRCPHDVGSGGMVLTQPKRAMNA